MGGEHFFFQRAVQGCVAQLVLPWHGMAQHSSGGKQCAIYRFITASSLK